MTLRSRTSGSLTYKSYMSPWFSSDKVACSGSLIRTNRGNLSYSDLVGERRYMTDEVVPNFRKRVADGEIIMNRMNSTHVTVNDAILGGPLIFTGNGWQCSTPNLYQSIYEFGPEYPMSTAGLEFQTVNGSWSPRTLLYDNELEFAIDEASTQCHADRGKAPQTIWETLAERKQSYEMLNSYLSSVKKASQSLELDLSRGKHNKFLRQAFIKGGRLAVAASTVHLITRYGLMPLISDIRMIVKQLQTAQDESERFTTRGKSHVERFSSSVIKRDAVSAHVLELGNTLLTDRVDVRATSIDEWKLTIADHYGFGTKDLVTLPWQLLTLSFVADWFVNVGKFLDAIVPTPGVNQRGACISYQRVRSYTSNITGYSGKTLSVVSSSATMSKTGTVVEKVRIPGLRAPTIVLLNRSRIDPALIKNHDRAVDAVALIVQRLGAAAVNIGFHLQKR